jgi:hypothetical protein
MAGHSYGRREDGEDHDEPMSIKISKYSSQAVLYD